MKKPLRISLFAAALLYAVVLAYVLFFWSRLIGYEQSWRSVNLRPFAEIAHAYLSGDGLVRSQFVQNIVLFAPLGFLLPLLFPRAAGAFWKTALFALGVSVCAEIVQAFIGRSADIDDVIANSLGAAGGYALYVLAGAVLGKTAFWRALSLGERRHKPLSVLAAALGFALLCGAPFALDYLDAKSPYGLFRYTDGRIPADAAVTVDFENADFGGLPVYSGRIGLAEQTAERVLALFPAPEGVERSETSTDGYGGGEMLWVTAQDGSYRLTAYGDGGFHLNAAGAYPEDAESFGAWVKGVLPQLAPAGVTLEVTDVHVEEGGVQGESNAPGAVAERAVMAYATAKTGDETVLVLGQIYFTYYPAREPRKLSINSSIVLADPAGSVKTISAAEALRAARGENNYAYPYEDVEITAVELVYREVRGLFLPCYSFTGTAKHEGKPFPFTSAVDAVKR